MAHTQGFFPQRELLAYRRSPLATQPPTSQAWREALLPLQPERPTKADEESFPWAVVICCSVPIL